MALSLSLSTHALGFGGLNDVDSAELCSEVGFHVLCKVGFVLFNVKTLNFEVVNGDSPQVTRAETSSSSLT